MLIIRREQMEIFSRAAVDRFERDLMAELRERYPARYAELGDAAVLQFVRGAERRLAVHSITAEDDVAKLAELDFNLGKAYESAKGHEWAAAILQDPSIIPTARVTLILARQTSNAQTLR